MKRAQMLWCALISLAMVAVSHAATPAGAELEIATLLADVAASGCQFYRNGSWYDAARAQAHLRLKYQALAARGQINSAEDFIARAATRSSFSGEAYRIRCPGNAAEPSDQWLREHLIRNRAKGAAGITRAAPFINQVNQYRAISRPS